MQIRDFLNRYQQGERSFAHVNLSGANLSGINLQDIDLSGANLTEANLSWASLTRANLTGACLRQADLRSAALNHANFSQVILSGANLSKADLRLSDLQGAALDWAILQEADLSLANLQSARLDQANLEKAKLNNAKLMDLELMEANLHHAILTGADLSRANLREANLASANLREANLMGANLTEANLTDAYLRQANLQDADLHRVILQGADLSEVNLNNADLSRANLSGAYLLKASCRGTYLPRADLQDAYLLQADLSGANLRGANLRRADLSGAYLNDTTLVEANLTDAYLLQSHLIRTSLDGVQMTGCCVYGWQLEDSDLSKVSCQYIFTRFNYHSKRPCDRYPVDREFVVGELSEFYYGSSTSIVIPLTEPPNWQVLVFVLAQLEQDFPDLRLTIRAFELTEDQGLLRLITDRPVNVVMLEQRFLKLYAKLQGRWDKVRGQVLALVGIRDDSGAGDRPSEVKEELEQPSADSDSPKLANQPKAKSYLEERSKTPISPKEVSKTAISQHKIQVYQGVVAHLQSILSVQTTQQYLEKEQKLLNFLKSERVRTKEAQQRIISQVVMKRIERDKTFLERLVRWEKLAAKEIQFSMVGEVMRSAIALFWSR